MRAQRQHDIKNHADSSEIFAREAISSLVRINDRFGVGERIARQMVIGNQDRHSCRVSGAHAVNARDTVIYSDQ